MFDPKAEISRVEGLLRMPACRVDHPKALRAGKSEQAFVLVAVILLVALATTLVVTATMVARVERKAASNTAKIEQARANALFALDVALNQLQREAGPDQRVTARAEILDSNPGTDAVDGVSQPYWTGVWKTGTRSLDIANSGTPQRQTSLGSTTPTMAEKIANAAWLVSGFPDPSIFAGGTNSPGATAVVMAKHLGASSVNVTVPLVALTTPGGNTTTTNGAYAYWVSDEGVKAKVNQTAQSLDATSASERQLHAVLPQGVHQGKGILGSANFVDLRGAAHGDALAKTSTLSSFQFVPGIAAESLAGDAAKGLAADATTFSLGVLSDVRRGGLKKDLTAAFEDPGNTPGKNYAKLNPNGTASLYRASTDAVTSLALPAAAGAKGLDGLKWLNLYWFYNRYKQTVMPAPPLNLYGRPTEPNGAPPWGIGNPEAALPYSVSPGALGWTDPVAGNPTYGLLVPNFLGYRWDASLSARPLAGGGPFRLQMNYYFQIVLHNPYPVTLHAPLNNFRYSRAMPAAADMYLETQLVTGNGTNHYYTAINAGAALQRMLFATSFDDSQSLRPGETRVFGLSQASPANLTIKQACEYRDNTAPFGFASKGYAPTFNRTADLQRITSRHTAGGRDPTKDTYEPVPDVPAGSTVRLRITGDPGDGPVGDPTLAATASTQYWIRMWSFAADVGIPYATLWPTPGGSAASTLSSVAGKPGSGGARVLTPGTPATGYLNRPNYGPFPIETLPETQVLSIYIRKKGLMPSDSTPPRYANSGMILPYFCGNSGSFNCFYDTTSAWWDEIFTAGINSAWPVYPPPATEMQLDISGDGFTNTGWGDRSTGVDAPGLRIVHTDIPIQPMVSLGQLMHIKPYYHLGTGAFTNYDFGSMFIGGSCLPPEGATDVTAQVAGTNMLVADHSFLANQALFDSYFFSTVPPAGGPPAGTTWPSRWTAFNAANAGARVSDPSTPLLNGRLKPYFADAQGPLLDDLRDMDRAAANLLLDGAFNINSTSEEAWVALLSSLSGNSFTFYNATAGSAATLSAAALQNPIIRFFAGNTSDAVNTRWSGVRALSDVQVRELARQIVVQVKTRGPFLSMADFLNRRLGSTSSQLTRAGALQNAIDRTDLNNGIKTGYAVDITTGATTPLGNLAPYGYGTPQIANMRDASSDAGALWDSAIGVPGYLMQQDLVQNFSAVLTARSDTFVVRVYGEARNPRNGEVEARAWGEAVVQRVPELFDSTQPGHTEFQDMNPTNQTFGRRFKVASFRWLSPDEV